MDFSESEVLMVQSSDLRVGMGIIIEDFVFRIYEINTSKGGRIKKQVKAVNRLTGERRVMVFWGKERILQFLGFADEK
jgi:translation elongation factor P/translation initiation factor 5A